MLVRILEELGAALFFFLLLAATVLV